MQVAPTRRRVDAALFVVADVARAVVDLATKLLHNDDGVWSTGIDKRHFLARPLDSCARQHEL